jgi:hypothetical protein
MTQAKVHQPRRCVISDRLGVRGDNLKSVSRPPLRPPGGGFASAERGPYMWDQSDFDGKEFIYEQSVF